MEGRGRVLGIDVGERRVGLAISDPTQTLARPLTTLTVIAGEAAVTGVLREVERLGAEDDGLAAIAIGLPTRLDGSPNGQTARVLAFIAALTARTALPIVRVDERLSSHEAESRLALRERDWRRRKARLDAAAAAVILQDYLDHEREREAGRAGQEAGRARQEREAGETDEADGSGGSGRSGGAGE